MVIALNNFAVSLALGAIGADRRWRIIVTFGVFEFTIPLIGLILGRTLAGSLASALHWLVPLLLFVIGVLVILESLRFGRDDERLARMASSWGDLILLAAGLGVDNLVVGFSLGLAGLNPLLLAAMIGLCSVCFTAIGLALGHASRRHWESPTEFVAGAALLFVAFGVWQGWI
jgi:putative Mn2+ efflux pump MntP